MKPIIFSTDMVRAILDGRKTQTRRVIKPQPHYITSSGRWCWPIPKAKQRKGCCSQVETASREWWEYLLVDQFPYCPGDILVPAKEIIGYDVRYCADVFGNIWSKASGKWKKLKANITAGYLRLTLRKNSKDVNRTVHKLVCATYYGETPFEGAVVRHLDGNSINNAPDNLDWGTYSQNWDDAKFHGTMIHEKHHNAKITMEIAESMRASGKTSWELSKEYNVTPKTIRRVLNGQTWKPVYEQAPPNMPRAAARLFLLVKNVWAERLQDITPKSIAAEGLPSFIVHPEHEHYKNVCGNNWLGFEWFHELWNSLNKKRGYPWDSNPWVEVIEFERTEVPS